jgi:hypothetical protein
MKACQSSESCSVASRPDVRRGSRHHNYPATIWHPPSTISSKKLGDTGRHEATRGGRPGGKAPA